MWLLELCSGTKSVSKVARDLGWETVSLDICPRHTPALCVDIMDFDESQYPKDCLNFIWASPDCRAHSSARTVAKIAETRRWLHQTNSSRKLEIIDYFGCSLRIENPATSRLWNREAVDGLQCIITSYCCHGYAYRKDTKLASNALTKLPRCPGPGLCPRMIGKRHREHAQKGGGGLNPGDLEPIKIWLSNVGSDASTD